MCFILIYFNNKFIHYNFLTYINITHNKTQNSLYYDMIFIYKNNL